MKNIKRLDPNRYEIYFSYQDTLTGNRKYVRRRVEGSLQDAVAERDRLKVAAREGRLGRNRLKSGRPLKHWFDDYVEHRKHRDQVAASTLQTERYYLTGSILPDVGDWLPEAVELHHLDELVAKWLSSKKKDGSLYSRTTIANHLRYLKHYLRWVLKRCGRDPSFIHSVECIRRRKGDKRRGRALTPSGARTFLTEMKMSFPHHYALCFVLLATGQRFGSVTALTWADVGAEWITFARSQYRGTVKEGSKTGKVVRLPLSPEMATVLDWHRAEMVNSQYPGLSTDLIFPTMTPPEESATGGYRCAGDLRHAFRKVCEATGIDRITPHDLRRTFNTWAAERVSGTVLRSITGHSSKEMTDHYYHGSKEAKAHVIGEVISLMK